MKGSDFVFDYVCLLYCHKTNMKGIRSYINSPDWIQNKKATINLINEKYNKCFQYSITVALNHEEIKKDLQRIKKLNLL